MLLKGRIPKSLAQPGLSTSFSKVLHIYVPGIKWVQGSKGDLDRRAPCCQGSQCGREPAKYGVILETQTGALTRNRCGGYVYTLRVEMSNS